MVKTLLSIPVNEKRSTFLFHSEVETEFKTNEKTKQRQPGQQAHRQTATILIHLSIHQVTSEMVVRVTPAKIADAAGKVLARRGRSKEILRAASALQNPIKKQQQQQQLYQTVRRTKQIPSPLRAALSFPPSTIQTDAISKNEFRKDYHHQSMERTTHATMADTTDVVVIERYLESLLDGTFDWQVNTTATAALETVPEKHRVEEVPSKPAKEVARILLMRKELLLLHQILDTLY